MTYYTVFIRPTSQSPWEVHLGFYDRDEAEFEKQDLLQSYNSPFQARIVRTTSDSQSELDQALTSLNRELSK